MEELFLEMFSGWSAVYQALLRNKFGIDFVDPPTSINVAPSLIIFSAFQSLDATIVLSSIKKTSWE
jgi:hypothetical protein